MRERNLVVAAVVGALIFRVMRDMGKGGITEVRHNAASYVAIGAAAGIAGVAVEVFPPAGLTLAGLLVITVALSSTRTGAGGPNTFFDDLVSKIFGPLAGDAVAMGSSPTGSPGNPVINPRHPGPQ